MIKIILFWSSDLGEADSCISQGIAVSCFLPKAATKRGRHYIKDEEKH